MMWSKLRKEIKNFICEDLRDIIDVQCTGYHEAHDGVGEAYITVNKEKVYGCGYYKAHVISNIPTRNYYSDNIILDNEVLSLIYQGNVDTPYIVHNLELYMHKTFEELYVSNNPIYRAFMLVDRRLGKRRFESIVINENESELVKIFYNLREEVFNKK